AGTGSTTLSSDDLTRTLQANAAKAYLLQFTGYVLPINLGDWNEINHSSGLDFRYTYANWLWLRVVYTETQDSRNTNALSLPTSTGLSPGIMERGYVSEARQPEFAIGRRWLPTNNTTLDAGVSFGHGWTRTTVEDVSVFSNSFFGIPIQGLANETRRESIESWGPLVCLSYSPATWAQISVEARYLFGHGSYSANRWDYRTGIAARLYAYENVYGTRRERTQLVSLSTTIKYDMFFIRPRVTIGTLERTTTSASDLEVDPGAMGTPDAALRASLVNSGSFVSQKASVPLFNFDIALGAKIAL
ncbi:MAG TPA: hypothetical protein PKE49_06340, partial [Leptospiraceae bacterium]|nr:hypothetical protein [Leptospiraceae bacterium]